MTKKSPVAKPDTIAIWEYPSASNPDTVHTTKLLADSTFTCTCMAWRFPRGSMPRSCKHTRQSEAKIRTEGFKSLPIVTPEETLESKLKRKIAAEKQAKLAITPEVSRCRICSLPIDGFGRNNGGRGKICYDCWNAIDDEDDEKPRTKSTRRAKSQTSPTASPAVPGVRRIKGWAD